MKIEEFVPGDHFIAPGYNMPDALKKILKKKVRGGKKFQLKNIYKTIDCLCF